MAFLYLTILRRRRAPSRSDAPGPVTAVRQPLKSRTRTYLRTTTRRGFWLPASLILAVRSTWSGCGFRLTTMGGVLIFLLFALASHSRIDFVSPRGTSLFLRHSELSCEGFPAGWFGLMRLLSGAGPFPAVQLNWAFPAVHPCPFLVLDHGRTLFFV